MGLSATDEEWKEGGSSRGRHHGLFGDSEESTSAHHVTCLMGNDVRARMGQNLNLRHPQGQAKRSGYYLPLNWDQL